MNLLEQIREKIISSDWIIQDEQDEEEEREDENRQISK